MRIWVDRVLLVESACLASIKTVAAALRMSREYLGRRPGALPGLRAEQIGRDGDPARDNTIIIANGGEPVPHVGRPESGKSVSNDVLVGGNPR